ncbi:alkaline phosphatase D family protein [Alteromonadaceae bacterium BrNp21-10]|nr:alkaline phosphatase D family protein [Alteromonadaceae bacterium BrNp21-10]
MKSIYISLITLLLTTTAQANESMPLNNILFGSCSHQDKPKPIMAAINAEAPDLFIFLGDNIYADTTDMQKMATMYQKLGSDAGIQTLRQNTPVIAIWDDHDFGENDAGSEYPKKQQSKQLMLDFWHEPKDSIRRTQKDGVYTAYSYGSEEQRVQVIMPDLRWNRAPLNHVSREEYLQVRKPAKQGPYSASNNPTASMLGEHQWQWLEQQLKKPAKIKIIASSIQAIPEQSGWESWSNYPHDRKRLLKLIKQHKINGVVLISGDTHWGEISRYQQDVDYPLWEVTSSGLTEEWKDVSPNKYRVNDFTNSVNYGAININWSQADPEITLALKDINGATINQQQLRLSTISPYPH